MFYKHVRVLVVRTLSSLKDTFISIDVVLSFLASAVGLSVRSSYKIVYIDVRINSADTKYMHQRALDQRQRPTHDWQEAAQRAMYKTLPNVR